MSGPADVGGSTRSSDDLVAKIFGTEELARRIPFNTNNADEYSSTPTTISPKSGRHEIPDDPLVGASIVTESNGSEKAWSGGPPIGANKTIAPLDRVRVDSTDGAITTNQGVPVADNQNSLRAGLRGPTLLEDVILREKRTHFDHERIPERIVHARGSAAHGVLECARRSARISDARSRGTPPSGPGTVRVTDLDSSRPEKCCQGRRSPRSQRSSTNRRSPNGGR